MSISKFWLASNSPRRREIITWPGWPYDIAPANIDETSRAGEAARDYVKRLALEKCRVPVARARAGDVIIAADTIVVLDGEIMGKPVDSQNAVEMLKLLRDRSHQVITALAVRIEAGAEVLQDICVSNIHMRNYSDDEIQSYVKSGDPLDKAGGYAIQNPEFHPVIDFCGCYAGVMGMPLCHLERTLRKLAGYRPTRMAPVCKKNLNYVCPITERVMSGEDIG